MGILTVLRDINYSTEYFVQVINEINKLGINTRVVMQKEYLVMDQDAYEVLIYNSFPDETHPWKFDKELIGKCDEKFNNFKGAMRTKGMPNLRQQVYEKIKHYGPDNKWLSWFLAN